MRHTVRILLLVSLVASSLAAQTQRKFLVPVATQDPAPGAYGSSWVAELKAFNGSDTKVFFSNTLSCVVDCPPIGLAHSVFELTAANIAPNGGAFVYANLPEADDLSFSLRARDLSRESEDLGSEIPVVTESELHTRAIEFPDVPLDSRYRVTVRVYDFDLRASSVAVVAYDTSGAELGRSQLALTSSGSPGQMPAGAMIADAGSLAGAGAPDRVRVEIQPLTAGMRFWALLTVTNNTTQHVTILTPQPMHETN